jgi:hypothetical protein
MSKVNVEKWFEYDESTKLENQVKYFIASTVEGYLNGCYDCDYEPMTRQEWIDYVWQTIEYEKDIIVNGVERKHLYYYGKENTVKLINKYLDNYECVQPYIK